MLPRAGSTTASASRSAIRSAIPNADTTTPITDPPLTAPLLALAALALGYALQLSDGHYLPEALLWLALALALVIVAVAAPAFGRGAFPPAVLTGLLGGGILGQLALFLQKPPGIYLAVDWPGEYAPFFGGLAVAAALVGVGLWDRGPLRRVWFPALLLTHFLLGAWVLERSPVPDIDVFVFQQGGSAALLRGENPYGLTFPDIYGDKPYYGPGLSDDGRVDFGFPYPPLSLFLALPGYLVAGDHRYAQLLAMVGAGALLAVARPGRIGALAAATLLFSPRAFFVIEQGWTEPFVILGLALTVACACRWPRALPLALGLLLASKQTMVFVPLVAFLLVGGLAGWRAWWGLIWRAGVVALAVSLPLALGALRGFAYSVVLLQLYQPPRADALSYAAALARAGLPAPTWLAFAAVVPALALTLRRGARTPAGFAAGVGLVYLAFFAVNKQAFCNYYFFALGALCCAVAAAQPGGSAMPAPRREISAVKGATVSRSGRPPAARKLSAHGAIAARGSVVSKM
ncbi:MAG: hypothetical protein AVDCRST_MAG18-1147 [uncultured Thermomicrobiales bacterium]|uniref:DUF2029 domain-containing protein n=1 Tax=uncultured Thermomicrobiales bacterium TaxID=1645740 RepID=A0A6J4UX79_9BACT|nr:MAG: hypothetical protein AVDCRST_MAG18-1147 [uncultured Thermomicrobiales bacterium]